MDSTTLYQRIAETIRADILEGRLRPGDRLPSIRELTRTWACTPGTVQRAYQELTRQGLVVSQPGKGTHVAGGIDTRLIQAQGPLRTALLVNRSEAFLLELLTGGFEPGEIAQAFELALDRWHALKRLNTPPEQLVLRFHGSHDQAVTWIASHFNHIAPNWEMELTFSGSLNGLMALAEGRAEVAGCHLLDVETGSYNLPFLSKLFPGKHMAAIRLAERSIGLILPAGNPQRLAGLHDLTRPGLRFANRQEGSGTRVWLDAELARLGISPADIGGFRDEKATHSEVARAVAEGAADAGLGLQSAAAAFRLDYLPLVTESYDLVVSGEALENEPFPALIAWLRSPAGREVIGTLPGYNAENSGTLTLV